METSTKLTVIAAVFLVVVVTAIGIHMMSQDQDSDDGFTPNPPVSGDWNYTAYISANADKTTFYEGTLRITVEDNEMTRFQQNIVKTLASEMTDDELELALGEIGKHNTGSDWPGGTWWPPESAPDYIITHSYDYAMEFENLNDEDLITYNGEKIVVCLFGDDDGVRYWIAEDGVIYAVVIPVDDTSLYFKLD